MMLSVFALQADADGHLDKTCTVNETYNSIRCTYPGPFTVHPAAPQPAYGFGSGGANTVGGTPTGASIPVAGADAGGSAGGGTGGGLAHTGSESAVLGYVGAGMIAFGAVAMGSRRKFFQGALED